MTLPAFSVSRPIARGIAHPIAAHEGVGVPVSWVNLLFKNDSDIYVALLFKGDDDVYRNLTGKDR